MSKWIPITIILFVLIQACSKSTAESQAYVWQNVTTAASYPQSYNFPVFVMNGGMLALNSGAWISTDDGKAYFNDVWNSDDGVKWQQVTEKAAWSPRQVTALVAFKNRLWIFGGGVIDGDKEINPDSQKEVWSSEDGINWTQERMKSERNGGGTPIIFDDKLWFVGANRNDGNFGNAVTVSGDGVTWQALSAPWSPRGGVAVWVFDNKLFMTGGKYSYTEANGEIKFVYSNDVWVMSKKSKI